MMLSLFHHITTNINSDVIKLHCMFSGFLLNGCLMHMELRRHNLVYSLDSSVSRYNFVCDGQNLPSLITVGRIVTTFSVYITSDGTIKCNPLITFASDFIGKCL